MKISLIREKDNSFGGAENYLSRLHIELEKLGFYCKIIRSPFPGFLPSWIRVILFNFYLCFKKDQTIYFSLERITCPDIYRAGDGVHKVFFRNMKKTKLNPLHFIYQIIERKCFENSKLIIANSHMVKNQIVSTYSIPVSKIVVIYNGVKIPREKDINLKCDETYEKYNIDSSKKIFLFVGHGFDRKGLKSFLILLSQIQKGFQALVIGGDKDIKKYINFSEELGISDAVFFLGHIKEVNIFYQISDVVILPTKYDPFSNVILEAMSYKNLVITTKQNGAHEILDKDWIMNSHKDYKVVNRIQEVIEDEDLLNEIKNKNYILSKKFSIEKNAEDTLKAIKDFYV